MIPVTAEAMARHRGNVDDPTVYYHPSPPTDTSKSWTARCRRSANSLRTPLDNLCPTDKVLPIIEDVMRLTSNSIDPVDLPMNGSFPIKIARVVPRRDRNPPTQIDVDLRILLNGSLPSKKTPRHRRTNETVDWNNHRI
jgi:hypothetical protein